MRTTVLIPLHRSAAWTEVVSGNVERLAGVARVVVSDATGRDDTLEVLRARRPGHVEFVGPRSLRPGWTAHCDDLVERVGTDYVMWLPHDDEIGADWVRDAEFALDANPDAVLACGPIRPIGEPGPALDVDPGLTERQTAERAGRVLDLVRAEDWGAFGLLFRGVFRRTQATPLDAGDEDAWADVLWGIRMALRGPIAAIPAQYGKRWYAESTHATWSAPDLARSAWAADLAAALDDVPVAVLRRGFADAATDAVVARRNASDLTVARHEIEELRASTSWRWTGPLRAAGARLRRR